MSVLQDRDLWYDLFNILPEHLTTHYNYLQVPYIAAEYPLTLTIKKFGPNRVLPLLVASWGLVCCLQGLVTSYSGLLAARFFLGLTEGGILPGLVIYMSMYACFLAHHVPRLMIGFYRFWTRHQMQLRLSVLFTASRCFEHIMLGRSIDRRQLHSLEPLLDCLQPPF